MKVRRSGLTITTDERRTGKFRRTEEELAAISINGARRAVRFDDPGHRPRSGCDDGAILQSRLRSRGWRCRRVPGRSSELHAAEVSGRSDYGRRTEAAGLG